LLGEQLQGLGLARAGSAGHQTVTIHGRQRDTDLRSGIRRAVDYHRS
jgi:hypothetical protein